MDFSELMRACSSLALVAAMIWATAWILKRSGLDKRLSGLRGTAQGRLQMVDALHVDSKRKLMLVRADKKEYLLLLGADNAILLDTLTTDEPQRPEHMVGGPQRPAYAGKESE